MSMLSSQIDELRRMADGQATYRDARAVMLQAADTIAELRGALSVASVDYRHLSEENDKLRELLQDVNKAAHMLCEAWEGSCSKEAEGMSLHAVCPISDTNELCVFGKLYERIHELGIEVDDGQA